LGTVEHIIQYFVIWCGVFFWCFKWKILYRSIK